MVKSTVAALLAALAPSCIGVAQETVLYDFWSPSCGPCRQMEPTVGRLISAGHPVQKINAMGTPAEQKLARRLNVRFVPCFVMLVDGREVDRVQGPTSYQRLEQMVRHAARPTVDTPAAHARTQSPDPPGTASPWSQANAAAPTSGMTASQPWPAATAPQDHADAAVTRTPNLPDTRQPTAYALASHQGVAPVERELINASVRLKIGDEAGHSWGTGTIIDARSGEALIVTCGHVFRESQGKGPVLVEMFEATTSGPRVVEQVAGQVISFDLQRDIGLVSIRPSATVRVAPVAASVESIQVNDRVLSVGCSHGADPTAIATRVTALNRYLGPPNNIEAAGAPVEGRSGGGLFNEHGELIGVCYAADNEGDEGLYVGLASIHAELDRLGLSEIYTPSQPPRGQLASSPRSGPPGRPLPTQVDTAAVVRGQEPLQPIAAIADHSPRKELGTSSAERSTTALAGTADLAPVEQAAWEEIMARTEEAEVICIIRPKSPHAKSEIITLPSVSGDFVRRLSETGARAPLRR